MLELVLVTMCVGADRRMLMIMSEQFTDKRVLIILTVELCIANFQIIWFNDLLGYRTVMTQGL